jgi:hypothetical protein
MVPTMGTWSPVYEQLWLSFAVSQGAVPSFSWLRTQACGAGSYHWLVVEGLPVDRLVQDYFRSRFFDCQALNWSIDSHLVDPPNSGSRILRYRRSIILSKSSNSRNSCRRSPSMSPLSIESGKSLKMMVPSSDVLRERQV